MKKKLITMYKANEECKDRSIWPFRSHWLPLYGNSVKLKYMYFKYKFGHPDGLINMENNRTGDMYTRTGVFWFLDRYLPPCYYILVDDREIYLRRP